VQYFPSIGPSDADPNPPKSKYDRNFALQGRVAGLCTVSSIEASQSIVFTPRSDALARIDVLIATPRDLLLKELESQQAAEGGPASWISIPQTHVYSAQHLETLGFVERSLSETLNTPFAELVKRSEAAWSGFWVSSAVAFQDRELERDWYHNQYFLACCLRKYRTAPGLFANWSSGEIGSAWHSDYHLDYNCQQVYWGVFSSNHVDMHAPYVEWSRICCPCPKNSRETVSICPERSSRSPPIRFPVKLSPTRFHRGDIRSA
jgi:hypothetical protein